MPLIYEAVVTSRNPDGSIHITPMGFREVEGRVVLAPFKPSTTLENLRRTGQITVNLTDDVCVIAGCLTGRRDWPVKDTEVIDGARLAAALAHRELEVARVEEDPQRPRFYCREVHSATHAPFRGFNRAQAAVLEAAILVSRLGMLSSEKIQSEIDYLKIAVEKTAGPREREAWEWLQRAIRDFEAGEMDAGVDGA